jgi:hypothetical protein
MGAETFHDRTSDKLSTKAGQLHTSGNCVDGQGTATYASGAQYVGEFMYSQLYG